MTTTYIPRDHDNYLYHVIPPGVGARHHGTEGAGSASLPTTGALQLRTGAGRGGEAPSHCWYVVGNVFMIL